MAGMEGAAGITAVTRPAVAGADASGKEVPTTGAGESARGRRKRVTCGAAGGVADKQARAVDGRTRCAAELG